MLWNYIKCENYGSFAACRNRETTEPGIFMLPAFWRFFKLFLYAARQPSLVNDLFRGKLGERDKQEQDFGADGWEKTPYHEVHRDSPGLPSHSDLVSVDLSGPFFLLIFQVCVSLIKWRWTWSKQSSAGCACMFRNMLFFLDFQDLFHSSFTAVIFAKSKLLLLWHSCSTASPRPRQGQICVLKGTVSLLKVEEV